MFHPSQFVAWNDLHLKINKMGNRQSAKKNKRRKAKKSINQLLYSIPGAYQMEKLIEQNFTPECIQEARSAFMIHDKHSNGTIETKQLINVMRSLGKNPTEDEIIDIINSHGEEGKGVIHFIHFLDVWKQASEDLNESIKEAFDVFDDNGSGAIDVDEFRKVMATQGAQMSEEDIMEIIKEVDLDGDRQINLEEFVNLLKNEMMDV